MAGVPSIVMGLFIYTIWVLRFGAVRPSPVRWPWPPSCCPIVIRSTEEMLRLVPNDLREASVALGASKSRTILTVVLPAALPGITSGSLLAVARAAGETAPAAVHHRRRPNSLNLDLFAGTNAALSPRSSPTPGSPSSAPSNGRGAAAFTLIVLVLVLTVVARIISRRFTLR